MAQPVLSDLHVDALLTDISVAFKNPAYFADEVFPIVSVNKQADRYVFYNRDYWFRDDADHIAPGGLPTYVGYDLSTCKYSCDGWDAAKLVSDAERSNADPAYDLDRDATEFVTSKLQLKREREMVADFLKCGVWGTSASGVAASATLSTSQYYRWDELAESIPIQNVRTAIQTIQQNTGITPNKIVIGNTAFSTVINHPDIIDRFKTGMAVTNEAILAQILGLPRVIVAQSLYVSTLEGASTQTYAYNFGKDALVLYTPDRPSLLMPSAGYTFVWSGGGAGAVAGQRILRWRHTERKSDVIEAESWFDQKLVSSALGYYFHDLVL